MTDPTVRTETHYYPADEINAMRAFYNGKTCVVSGDGPAHMLDAALGISNIRLQWMLDRHLRQDRHPKHAAEVRENVIPLSPNQHTDIDCFPPYATLFLHEDLLARTLAFEVELQKWRCAEMEAGRGDPGRPLYEDVFEVHGVTEHRWHCAIGARRFLRGTEIYNWTDCPGVHSSGNPFPVLDTLLSIPFSLLHNISRLSSMVPLSEYQCDLMTMGNNIIRLWSWDPSSTEVHRATIRTAGGGVNQTRTPAPLPIRDASRRSTTLETMRAQASYLSVTVSHSPAKNSLTPDISTIELASGEVLFREQPSVSWKIDGEQLEMDDKDWEDSIAASLGKSSVSMSESSNWSFDGQDVESHTQFSPPSEIVSWLNMVIHDEEKIPSLTSSPFEKGIIRSMSVNDILMIKGLIDPGVYTEYIDLESFSHR